MTGAAPLRVLLVGKDAEGVVRAALEGFEAPGFALSVAGPGAAGLESMLAGAHDICLVDEAHDGPAASELIARARETGSRAPLLLLTATEHGEVGRAALAAGASDYLPRAQLTSFTLERATRCALERAALRAQLDAAEVERCRRDQEVMELAVIISHDLRSPLQAIGGHAELLELRYAGKLGPGADATIEHILGGVTRLESMLSDMLRFAQATGPAVGGGPVSLDEVLEAALRELQPEMLTCEGTVGRVQPLPVVRGDAALLRQLLVNLVANAIKFRGGAPLRVEVSATRAEGVWQVDVADSGVGVPPKELPVLFTLYRRGSNAAGLPGSGVGLAICQAIVRRHGGRIWAENIATGGFRVSFTLPAPAPTTASEAPG